MARQFKKHMNVDVLDVLKQYLDKNTIGYKSDFEIDKSIIMRAATSSRQEDKTLLWMSRPLGTHCHSEFETFVKDSSAYNTWLYYAAQERDSILACAVEISGFYDGKVVGSVFEVDFQKTAQEIRERSVAASEIENVFQDGYVDHVSLDRSGYGYFADLVDKHGPIVESRTLPADKEALLAVLSDRKRSRNPISLADKIKSAEEKQIAQECSKPKGMSTAKDLKEFSER